MNWLKRFLTARQATCKSFRRPRPSLMVEELENRLVPSTTPLTLTVVSLGDTGTGTGTRGDLRYCINQANLHDNTNSASPDVIRFANGLHGTITLNLGQLDITDPNLDINGPGPGRIAISGNNASRVFDMEPGTRVEVSSLTVENGQAVGDGLPDGSNEGGGILNQGSLSLSNLVIKNNAARGVLAVQDGQGGGIYSSGSLYVEDVTVQGNTAGGGLTASNGEGGGIYSTAFLHVDDALVRNNLAVNTGAGGGIFAAGLATIRDSLILANQGTGIDLDPGSDYSRIEDNQIHNNTGAGIFLSGTSHVRIRENDVSKNAVGIELFASNYNTIEYNLVYRNKEDGIQLTASNNNSISANIIILNGSNGIELDSSSNNLISKNLVLLNGHDGVFLDAGSTGNSIKQNVMLGNKHFDAEDDSSGTGTAGTANTWSNNVIGTSNPSGLRG